MKNIVIEQINNMVGKTHNINGIIKDMEKLLNIYKLPLIIKDYNFIYDFNNLNNGIELVCCMFEDNNQQKRIVMQKNVIVWFGIHKL